jgi:hypothetical protein
VRAMITDISSLLMRGCFKELPARGEKTLATLGPDIAGQNSSDRGNCESTFTCIDSPCANAHIQVLRGFERE